MPFWFCSKFSSRTENQSQILYLAAQTWPLKLILTPMLKTVKSGLRLHCCANEMQPCSFVVVSYARRHHSASSANDLWRRARTTCEGVMGEQIKAQLAGGSSGSICVSRLKNSGWNRTDTSESNNMSNLARQKKRKQLRVRLKSLAWMLQVWRIHLSSTSFFSH